MWPSSRFGILFGAASLAVAATRGADASSIGTIFDRAATALSKDDVRTLSDVDGPLAPNERTLSPKELLGKRLFEDTTLSEPVGQSCASCHDGQKAFTGNAGSSVSAVAKGARANVLGNRNVPTAMYLRNAPKFSFELKEGEGAGAAPTLTPIGGLFYDGRADDLAAQAKGPFLNPREMNNASPQAVVDKVRGGRYASLARRVYGDAVFDSTDAAYTALAGAIATFEQTSSFQPFRSKFDDFLRGASSLSETEARGFALFKDAKKGNCISCHAGDVSSKEPSDWLFTDFTYDNIGVPRNTRIADNDDPRFYDLGLCARAGFDAVVPKGTEASEYCGAFKVPTLRNVERTGPYMHNGYFENLRDVVKFYATRDTAPELWYRKDALGQVERFDDVPAAHKKNVNVEEVPMNRKLGEAPALDDAEVSAIVAFLQTLTDRE